MIRALFTLLVQELQRPRRPARARQTRRCPWCGGWFNTTALQDAHERDCDQRPDVALASSALFPTPAMVLAVAFPPHARELSDTAARRAAGSRLLSAQIGRVDDRGRWRA